MHTIDPVGTSRYKAVVDAFASDIRAGRLPSGTRLPTHRQLAAREGIALVTASRVYAELEAMGLVSGEQGRGTFVRDIALPPGHGIDQRAAAADTIDLSFNYPALPGQADLLRHALRELAAAGDLEALLRYQPHRGRPQDRAAVARHLRTRGLCGRRRPGPDRQRLAARAGHDGHGGAADGGRGRGRRAHLPGLQGPRPHAPAGTGAAAGRAGRNRPRRPRAAVRDPAGPRRLRDADPAQPARLGHGRPRPRPAGRDRAAARAAHHRRRLLRLSGGARAASDRRPRTRDHRLRVRAVQERRHRPARRLRRGPGPRWCPRSSARSA